MNIKLLGCVAALGLGMIACGDSGGTGGGGGGTGGGGTGGNAATTTSSSGGGGTGGSDAPCAADCEGDAGCADLSGGADIGDACATCVQEAADSLDACAVDAAFSADCTGECADYVDCVLNGPPGGGGGGQGGAGGAGGETDCDVLFPDGAATASALVLVSCGGCTM